MRLSENVRYATGGRECDESATVLRPATTRLHVHSPDRSSDSISLPSPDVRILARHREYTQPERSNTEATGGHFREQQWAGGSVLCANMLGGDTLDAGGWECSTQVFAW